MGPRPCHQAVRVILALAQDNARQAGFHNVQTVVADGEDLPVEPGSFDAAACRRGRDEATSWGFRYGRRLGWR